MRERDGDGLTARAREIRRAARVLLEEEGDISMRHLAARVGIKAPTLYKHFTSKEVLEAHLISEGFREQAALFTEALEGSDRPITALTLAYRRFALSNRHLYRLMYDRPLDRALLVPGAEYAAAAPGIVAAGGDRELARAAWAFAHGMTILELNQRFLPDGDLDVAWQRGVSALEAAVRPNGAGQVR